MTISSIARFFFISLWVILAATASAQDGAQQPELSEAEKRFNDLEKGYKERLARDQEPVISRYLETLGDLKKSLIEEGKNAAAERVDSEIQWVQKRGWEKREMDLDKILRPLLESAGGARRPPFSELRNFPFKPPLPPRFPPRTNDRPKPAPPEAP